MMNRRDFLKVSALTVAAASVKLPALTAQENTAEPLPASSQVIAVRNGEPVEMFRRGMKELGGMKQFVKKGQKVCVKPNIGWDRRPELAADTNPELVGEIVRQALEAGAREVVVFDHTCDNARNCYRNSKIQETAEKAGARVVLADKVADYTELNSDKAVFLKKTQVFKELLDSDVFINVPILKNHGGARLTAAMKNLMGIVWDRRAMHKSLPQSIADSVLYRRPDLNIVDAYRIMTTNGPRGVGENDVKTPKYLFLSTDIVAVDAVAMKLLNYPLDRVPYLELGTKLGLGNCDESKIKITRLEAK